jgi:predicted RNA-binding Zn-ribbon protein involved in translation (DUF1610 family)
MKPETRARKEKMKKALQKANVQVRKEGKKLSTAENNKMMLNIISKQKHDFEEEKEIEEVIAQPKETHRHFNCPSCGIRVDLYGEAEAELCSKCEREKNI